MADKSDKYKEQIEKLKKENNFLKDNERKLCLLNDGISEMLNLTSLESIYCHISKSLQKYISKCIVLFVSLNEEIKETRLEFVEGIDNTLLDKIIKISGFNPVGKKYKLLPKHNDYFRTGKLVEFAGGLREFSGGQFPELVALSIEKMIGLKKIYTIGILKDDLLLAAIHFLNFREIDPRDISTVETFVKQAGVIIQKKIVEEALRESEKKLQQLNDDKNRFMQILSHDLRSPFNTLLGFFSLLLLKIDDYDKNKIKDRIQFMNQETLKTYNLLEDILLWSKSQSGKLPFNPQTIYFQEICDDVLSNFILNQKKIEIQYFQSEIIKFRADKDMIKTIIRNLLSNAIKFTKPNGRINIYAEKIKNSLVITISDNGIGIDKENLSKLWDFSKSYTTNGTSEEKGTGFGLMLCKEFVEKHSGLIWVESELGIGSDFKFSLPLS